MIKQISYQSQILNIGNGTDYVCNGTVPIPFRVQCSHLVNKIRIRYAYSIITDTLVGLHNNNNDFLPISLFSVTSTPFTDSALFYYMSGLSDENSITYHFSEPRYIQGDFNCYISATNLTAEIATNESSLVFNFEFILEE